MENQEVENLVEEAKAFDHQIEERIAHGHIPDLRRCEPCDWFYNNPWRRPAYVQLDFGEQFELIRDAISSNTVTEGTRPKVLEVGCGPGYLSLELARAGFDVTGIDLSAQVIRVAKKFAADDPWGEQRGPLKYIFGDFCAVGDLEIGSFDVVIFLGALHHFPDQAATLDRVTQLLKPTGIVVVHEPVRDRVTRGNAVFAHLLRVLLSTSSGFYKHFPIPADTSEQECEFEQLFAALRYETDDGENLQSANDNEAGYAEMRPALDSRFKLIEFSWRYAFFHEFIGGLRFQETINEKLARYLREVDRELCRLGVLSATEFFFVGRKIGG